MTTASDGDIVEVVLDVRHVSGPDDEFERVLVQGVFPCGGPRPPLAPGAHRNEVQVFFGRNMGAGGVCAFLIQTALTEDGKVVPPPAGKGASVTDQACSHHCPHDGGQALPEPWVDQAREMARLLLGELSAPERTPELWQRIATDPALFWLRGETAPPAARVTGWRPFSYEDKAATAPPENEVVWVVEESCPRVATFGYFDGFTFRLWYGTDDCSVTHWAPVSYPAPPGGEGVPREH